MFKKTILVLVFFLTFISFPTLSNACRNDKAPSAEKLAFQKAHTLNYWDIFPSSESDKENKLRGLSFGTEEEIKIYLNGKELPVSAPLWIYNVPSEGRYQFKFVHPKGQHFEKKIDFKKVDISDFWIDFKRKKLEALKSPAC